TTIARARASTGTARRKHRTMTRDLYMERPSSFQLRAKEDPYEFVRGGVDDFLTRTVLNDTAALEHYQSLGQLDGLAQVVRDENHGARLGGLQTQKLLVDLLPRNGIEGSEWLVEQEDGGIQHHGAA